MTDEPILKGLRVVEISAYVAAPLCGASLASLGADVVRIDPPGGGVDYRRWPLHGGRSLYWIGLNAGKRSVTIDMRTERGQRLAADLIVAAGTCVTNLALGDWMSYDALRTRRDDLVMLTIAGRPDGTAAVDYTVNAELGIPWITGPGDSAEPVNHVLPAWDLITAQTAATAIVAAELRRARTGRGANVRISLADVARSTATRLGLVAEAELEPEPRGRFGNYIYGTFGRDFRTADDRRVMVAALTPRQWRALVAATASGTEVAALEHERGRDFTNEGDRFACREELAGLFERWIAARPYAQVQRVFDEHAVLWAPYRTLKEFVAAQKAERDGVLQRVVQPGVGEVFGSASPISFANAGAVPATPAPELGAHTREVLAAWLGLSDAAIDEFRKDRVL